MNLVWFRQDLRLSDNPAFFNASLNGQFFPIYIHDDVTAGEYKLGRASRVWLHHSLNSLDSSLGGKLNLAKGNAVEVLSKVCRKYGIKSVYWNRCYEPWRIENDAVIASELERQGIECKIYNGSLLWEPWDILKSDGSFYKVFTAYFKNGCMKAAAPRRILDAPKDLKLFEAVLKDDLNLLPKLNWSKCIEAEWYMGENAAKERLERFLENGIYGYKNGRNYPSRTNVSGLSPHLHFGEISPNQVWYAAQKVERSSDLECFLTELAWREFSYYLLYHFPGLPKDNFQSKYDVFPWLENSDYFQAWCRGQTGYPIVDAGMRQLWQTGYMHNRVRMITASFLVKNMMLDWRLGQSWFWDCLVDADLASNSASWQWVAGSGADAAPYFRIFNPILQAQKFDPDGEYIRKFVPELRQLPSKYIFAPWQAPSSVLREAGVSLGKNYPLPIIDLQETRSRSLLAYKNLRS